MSVDYLRVIPADPSFVPAAEAARAACAHLSRALPRAEVSARTTDEIELVDAGSNFEAAYCPHCEADIDLQWWREAMSIAAESDFTELAVTMPCCDRESTLNDLRYDWPQGFARFVLEARNPGDELTDDALAALSRVLGCPLRVVRAHY